MSAGFILTGAQIYYAGNNSDGAAADRDYRYTTNGSDGIGSRLAITSTTLTNRANLDNADIKPISFQLATGDNQFNYSVHSLPGNYLVGLNLFFAISDSQDSITYNPSDFNPHVGDLTVLARVDVPTAATVLPTIAQRGVSVQTFNPGGLATVAGNSSFATGNLVFPSTSQEVIVTAFSANSNGSGSFTLNVGLLTVVATPEPSSIGLSALGALGLWRCVYRRRFRATKQLGPS